MNSAGPNKTSVLPTTSTYQFRLAVVREDGSVSPFSEARDADTLAALDSWGHQDFSVRAEVVEGGTIEIGDKVEPL